MATEELSIISVTDDGRQLNAHGYKNMAQVKRHLGDRLRNKGSTVFVLFVVVRTINDSFSTTTCTHLSSRAAQRFVDAAN